MVLSVGSLVPGWILFTALHLLQQNCAACAQKPALTAGSTTRQQRCGLEMTFFQPGLRQFESEDNSPKQERACTDVAGTCTWQCEVFFVSPSFVSSVRFISRVLCVSYLKTNTLSLKLIFVNILIICSSLYYCFHIEHTPQKMFSRSSCGFFCLFCFFVVLSCFFSPLNSYPLIFYFFLFPKTDFLIFYQFSILL